jgi:two-component system, cell cycle response regulator
VRRGELEAALGCVRDVDDVCFDDDPPALIAHRLRRLERQAMGIDPQTGVMNRASLLRAAEAELPAALILVNLDHFKRFNDEHGHDVGDELLRAAAERVRAAVAADAVVARIGGDGFAVALGPQHDARGTAAAIHSALLAAPLVAAVVATPAATAIGATDPAASAAIGAAATGPAAAPAATVTGSLGVVVRTVERSFAELLRRAEGALYAAKARGRNCIVEHAQREREAVAGAGDLDLLGFEEMTRVVAERVAAVISGRGRRVFQELRDQADVDALTGLYNRRYLDRRLAFEVGHAKERGTPLVLGLLDVDHFGEVNKRHGWPSGDRVLAEVAQRIRGGLRGSDWAARYGGEELCVVLEGLELLAARAVLERLRAAVGDAAFASTQGAPLVVTVSVGCAELAPEDTAEQLLERASTRLLEAKRTGRDRVC